MFFIDFYFKSHFTKFLFWYHRDPFLQSHESHDPRKAPSSSLKVQVHLIQPKLYVTSSATGKQT